MKCLRSILFTPAYNLSLIEKAAHSYADGVCIDLEDSVPLQAKEFAGAVQSRRWMEK